MGITQLNFAGLNKVEVAIARLKEFEPPEGYYLSFSGGKDSVVIYDLAVRAGVKFDAHYSVTGIDPPELVFFIRDNYKDIIRDKPSMTIWQGIQYHGMPFRIARWCCEVLKESSGDERRVITGIRWAESVKRSKRKMVEVCRQHKSKMFIHPIIDWSGQEVWEYIKSKGLPYCSLYDEGFTRLGCVLCPMITAKRTKVEMQRWPKLAEAWKRACYRWWDKQTENAKKHKTAESFWQYWLSRKGESKLKDAQYIMFDN